MARTALRSAAALLLLASVSACQDKNEPGNDATPSGPELPEGRTFISLVISTGASSREVVEGPTWGDFYNDEPSARFERYIDPLKTRVVIFDAEGNHVHHAIGSQDDDIEVIVHELSAANGLYHLYFDITNLELEKDQEYIAAVFANFDRTIDAENVDNAYFRLQEAIVGDEGGKSATDYYKGAIPMFGFLRWKYGTYADPETINEVPTIGRIPMLHSVCKIEVRLADPLEYPATAKMTIDPDNTPRLSFVKGRHLNTRGHIAPAKSTWTDPHKASTTDISFSDSFFELTGNRWTSETSEHLYLPARSDDGRSFYIYLPEASGLSMAPYFDALRLSVTVKYTPDDGSPERSITGTLFPSIYYDEENQNYPAYVNYNRWKLVRNHIYRFTITDLADETSLRYRVSQSGQQIIDVPTFD